MKMNIADALNILGIGTGDIRREEWPRDQWLEFKDNKMVNPEILTADDLRADDWNWSPY